MCRGEVKTSWIQRKWEYVKKKFFDLFLSARESDTKKDWDDCIIAIDDKGRELK